MASSTPNPEWTPEERALFEQNSQELFIDEDVEDYVE